VRRLHHHRRDGSQSDGHSLLPVRRAGHVKALEGRWAKVHRFGADLRAGLSGPPFESQSPFETERLRTSATTPTETTVLQQSRARCEQHAVSPFLNELADVVVGDCGISRLSLVLVGMMPRRVYGQVETRTRATSSYSQTPLCQQRQWPQEKPRHRERRLHREASFVCGLPFDEQSSVVEL
jgi:hypothetical protein